MTKLSYIATALLLTSITVAHAETANQPAAQGAASVNSNLTKNPDNKGLQNASERVQANEAKAAEKRADADKKAGDAKHKKDKKDKHEKHERMDKASHDKMERPAKPERPAR